MVVKLQVKETNCSFDVPIRISVSGLQSQQKVTLHSYTTVESGAIFECVAVYAANCEGVIDTSCDEASGGCYTGVDGMGLFWSMTSSSLNRSVYPRFIKLDVTTPLVVKLNVYEELIFTLEELDSRRKNLKKLASTHIKRWFMAAGTKRITLTVEKHGIHGTLFIPPGQGPFPAVVTIFGGHPGTFEFKAALLARHGFVTMALAFFGSPGLAQIKQPVDDWDFDLDYFDKAFDFLSSLSSVDSSRGFGVICISFSTMLVMAAASCVDRIRCVVWINGFIHVNCMRITYKGKKFGRCGDKYPFNYDYQSMITNDGLSTRKFFPYFSNPFDSSESLPDFFRRKDVSYLFIVGLADESVIAETWANQAEQLFQMTGHPSYKILRYPGAGHLIEPPYSPLNAVTFQKSYKGPINWGGKKLPHCRAQEHSWIEQIKFLKENLPAKLYSKM
nr:bile acid-CoA:amino acid N-acyltransferase isoform X1 [Ciona intestinalis]|eukprot:XP_002129206.1 bile acid-CoA:amino acid N-acyltransferase isoform X1 [Ciona intestinalis]